MNFYYYSLFLIFIIIALMIVIDPNVATFITLWTKFLNTKVKGFIWLIKNHPKNPIVNWLKYRESFRIAKELQKELENKTNKML